MKRITIPIYVIVAAGILFVGCSTSQRLTHEPQPVTHDTLTVTHFQYDSIYICKEITYEPLDSITAKLPPSLGGMGRIHETDVEYRYKFLHDTLRVVRVDSIPIIREVEVTKEVEHIPWYCKLLSWVGAITLLLFAIKFLCVR